MALIVGISATDSFFGGNPAHCPNRLRSLSYGRVGNLTLCISDRLRIAYFPPAGRSAQKNGTEIHNLLSGRTITKCLHSKQRSRPTFPTERCRKTRAPFPSHTTNACLPYVTRKRRTRDKQPLPHVASPRMTRIHPPENSLSCIPLLYLCDFRLYLGNFEKRGCQQILNIRIIMTSNPCIFRQTVFKEESASHIKIAFFPIGCSISNKNNVSLRGFSPAFQDYK